MDGPSTKGKVKRDFIIHLFMSQPMYLKKYFVFEVFKLLFSVWFIRHGMELIGIIVIKVKLGQK